MSIGACPHYSFQRMRVNCGCDAPRCARPGDLEVAPTDPIGTFLLTRPRPNWFRRGELQLARRPQGACAQAHHLGCDAPRCARPGDLEVAPTEPIGPE